MPWAAAAAAAPTAKSFIASVSGVYKVRFDNGLVDGTKYRSENILEITPYQGDAAYVRMDLQFANGHEGGILGMATFDAKAGDTLVYRTQPVGAKVCTVRFVFGADKVVTQATYGPDSNCSDYHGARGSLDGATWPIRSKRALTYLPRLLKSREYQEAAREYGARSNAAPGTTKH